LIRVGHGHLPTTLNAAFSPAATHRRSLPESGAPRSTWCRVFPNFRFGADKALAAIETKFGVFGSPGASHEKRHAGTPQL
jgi:hypothetical protein